MLQTHGGKKVSFTWNLIGDVLVIENEKGRIHKYQLDEIVSIIAWLQNEFGDKWFPLANDVRKLGNGSEVAGLGTAILKQTPGDITHAQGSSYLGVVLDQIGVLKWNERKKGIKWQILKADINKDLLLDLLG